MTLYELLDMNISTGGRIDVQKFKQPRLIKPKTCLSNKAHLAL